MLSTNSQIYKPIDEWLRESTGIEHDQPLALWSLPDPPPNVPPAVPYRILIALAIYGSPQRRLTLQEIYVAIEERFPYFRTLPEERGRDGRSSGKRWQRSVRHSLSREPIFSNDPQSINESGKGGNWFISKDRVAVNGGDSDDESN